MLKCTRWGNQAGLIAAIVSLAFFTVNVEAEQVTSVDAATVLDANGTKVGNLQLVDKNRLILRLDDGTLVSVQVDKMGFRSGSATVLYTTSDCSGTAYGDPNDLDPEALVPDAVLGPPGRTVYRLDPAGAAVDMLGMSGASSKQSGCEQCRIDIGCKGRVIRLFPLLPVVDLNTKFTAPFRAVPSAPVSPAQCCADCNGDGQVTVNELITGVNHALTGCAAVGLSPSTR